MSEVKNVTKETFREQVIESDKPVLVDFWAEWCGPCKKLGPVLEDVAADLGEEVVIAKVNVDEQRELAAMYQIMSIPALFVFKGGEKVDEMVGVKSKSVIVEALQKHL